MLHFGLMLDGCLILAAIPVDPSFFTVPSFDIIYISNHKTIYSFDNFLLLINMVVQFHLQIPSFLIVDGEGNI